LAKTSTQVAELQGGLGISLITSMGSYQVRVKPETFRDRDVAVSDHWDLTEQLLRVLQGEEEMIVKSEDVLNVVRTMERFWRSAAGGRKVWLDE